MNLLCSARARLRRGTATPAIPADAGVTLVEQVVAMSIFMIVMAVFMAGLVSMTTSTTRVQNTADASDAVRKAFLTMDRQVRYADSINLPGRGASGDWFVEFRSPAKAVTGSDGVITSVRPCTQWRYDTTGGQLLVRTWNDGTSLPGGWALLAAVVKNPTAAPFVLDRPGGSLLVQRLSVNLSAGRGAGQAAGRAQIASTFTARNSSAGSPSNADANNDGVSDTPVCAAGGRS